MIFNPIIKKNNSQIRQTKNWPFWDSWQKLYDDMKDTNLAEWLIKMYLFLPKFPVTEIKINDSSVNVTELIDIEHIDKKTIAKSVFKGLLSLNH